MQNSQQKTDSSIREGHRCLECLSENACKEFKWKALGRSAVIWEQLLVISEVLGLHIGNDSQETGSYFIWRLDFPRIMSLTSQLVEDSDGSMSAKLWSGCLNNSDVPKELGGECACLLFQLPEKIVLDKAIGFSQLFCP